MSPPDQALSENAPKKRTHWASLFFILLLTGLGIFFWLSRPSDEAGSASEGPIPAAEEEPISKEKKPIAGKVVTVIGYVQRPGVYAIPRNGRLSLREAIALAGGLNRLANARKVQINRNGKLMILDLRNERVSSVFLKPNDRVMVPERLF